MKRILLTVIACLVTVSANAQTASTWNVLTDTDEMSGEKSAYTITKYVAPTKPMRSPYGDTKAGLGVGCNRKSEWAYVVFTNKPNITDDITEDGYNRIKTRAKWDDDLGYVNLTQGWGDDALHFKDDALAIENIIRKNQLLLELNWHGSGRVLFKFPLQGSTAAITDMRTKCGRAGLFTGEKDARGPMVDGKRHGKWTVELTNMVETGEYVRGKRHGQWKERWAGGNVYTGPYMDDERHGQWEFRFENGGVQTGQYVDGEKHGRWELRWADGSVQTGQYVDDKQHGQWERRRPDGTVITLNFVNGELQY